MAWKPIREKNAIESVRLLIQFNTSLDLKFLNEISSQPLKFHNSMGFDRMLQAESVVQNIPLDPQGGGFPFSEKILEGWLISRHENEKLVEEAGFRVGAFGYMMTEYESWTRFVERYMEIFRLPLKKALERFGIRCMALNYSDKFVFDGDPMDADIAEVISLMDPAFPEVVCAENSLWHSHIGWFENINGNRMLIQRNIDVKDEQVADVTRRVLQIYSNVELRHSLDSVELDFVTDNLNQLHKKSVNAIGSTLSDFMKKELNLKLKD